MATPEEMAVSMVQNLAAKTGKPLEDWLKVVLASGLDKHGTIVKHFKTKYGVTHGYASLIAHKARQQGQPQPTEIDLVTSQYAGVKEGFRPIYDRLIQEISRLGKDVEISPKKSYVSLRRNKQFALIQPSTKTRVDVEINLKGVDPVGRLEASGSFSAMCSHRVRLSSESDVDQELINWLKQAYEKG